MSAPRSHGAAMLSLLLVCAFVSRHPVSLPIGSMVAHLFHGSICQVTAMTVF
jgi:hypothetical protein